MNQGVKITDTTMFDYELSPGDQSTITCQKVLYFFVLLPNLAILIFIAVGLGVNMNIINLLMIACSFVGILFTFFYVYFPKSSLARTPITKFMMVMYMILTVIFLGYTLLVIFLFMIIEAVNDPNDEFEGIWRYFYVWLALLAALPILHSILVIIILKQRGTIARNVQNVELSRGLLENNYQNPNVPPQMMGQPQGVQPQMFGQQMNPSPPLAQTANFPQQPYMQLPQEQPYPQNPVPAQPEPPMRYGLAPPQDRFPGGNGGVNNSSGPNSNMGESRGNY